MKDYMFDKKSESKQPFVEGLGYFCIGSIAFMGIIAGLLLLSEGKFIVGAGLCLLGTYSFLIEVFGVDLIRIVINKGD